MKLIKLISISIIITLVSFSIISCIPAYKSKKECYNMEKTYPVPYKPLRSNLVIIAHRGFSGLYPENTMIAFKKAIEIKADMLELDITFSKDGQIVVIHDKTTDRTTGIKGNVNDFTFEELRKMDAGSWFREEFKGEKIPTLEEVLKLCKGKIMVNIEIKEEVVNPDKKVIKGGIEEKAVKLVEKYGMEKHIIFSSFNHLAMKRVKLLNSSISTAVLWHKEIDIKPSDMAGAVKADAFNPNKKHLTKEFVKQAQDNGLKVNTYTINTKEEMTHFIDMGVDGIFTDRPDILIDLIKS